MKLDFLENMATDEKVELVGDIWNEIHKDLIEISNPQKDELDRRLERITRGETKYFSVDEVFEKIKESRKVYDL